MADKYRATINGFTCNSETWDDALELDGKHDEVKFVVNTKIIGRDGTVKRQLSSESTVMGDTNNQPGRVQAGSASARGGIRTGDRFPDTDNPWEHNGSLHGQRYPPYEIWGGELADNGDIIMVTPTLQEVDVASVLEGWAAYLVATDKAYGQRAKDIVSGVWPVAAPVFDAVSLGIQTFGSLFGQWGPIGHAATRPIGLQRDPADPNGILFNPTIIALSSETAEHLATANDQGLGPGITEIVFRDDSQLRGDYSVYVQIEKVGPAASSAWIDVGHANGVVAMTALDSRLFCATADNGLWMRDPVHREVEWQRIGHANGVVGMAATNGQLFCATSDNRLWTREPVAREVDWTDIGHANRVVGMTALEGRLFCATSDNRLWMRDAVLSEVNWTDIGHANDVVAMAAGGGRLFCATRDNRLWTREPVAREVDWQPIGNAPSVRGLAATGSDLFAATEANRLLVRSLH
jgi:hypothetical protein